MIYSELKYIQKHYRFDYNLVNKIDKYLSSLNKLQGERITADSIAKQIYEKYDDVLKVLYLSSRYNLLKINLELYCPVNNELISIIDFVPDKKVFEIDCPNCKEVHKISTKKVVITFALLKYKFNIFQDILRIIKSLFKMV